MLKAAGSSKQMTYEKACINGEAAGIPADRVEAILDENPDLCFCSDENGQCYDDLTQYLEQRAKEFEAVTV